MRTRSLALGFLMPMMVLVAPFNTWRSGVAENGEPSLSHLSRSLTTRSTSFTVTNLNDSGIGSLRQAILDSNANPGADEVVFIVTGTITLTTGELLITDGLTIRGPGALLLTVSGNHTSRVFNIIGASVT